jgi:hypothetical protein
MPQDRATADELLTGVAAFLRDEVLPQLNGASAYKCRVAANILAIVQREFTLGDRADRAELAGLQALLGNDRDARGEVIDDIAVRMLQALVGQDRDECDTRAALDAGNAELCARIRAGALDDRRAEVFAHVRRTVRDKLAIANPKYPALRE